VSLSGTKFNDVNGNGVKDAGEAGLPGWTIFLDANNDGILTTGETNTQTDASGNYTFSGLFLGTYKVREVSQSGWTMTTANPSDIVVNTSGQTFTGINIGNFQNVTISGMKFNDVNGNGVKDAGDTGLQGWTIYLDANNDSTLNTGEVSTQTDGSGNYSFTGLTPGTYRVREVQQSGWTRTTANPSAIVAQSGTSVSNVNFGNFQLVSISGMKFNDVNGNGVKDAGDAGLQGWTIYLDANGNDTLNTGETTVTTDVNGNYSFTNLTAGTYRVREVQQSGWTRTTANPAVITTTSGTNTTGVNFGNFG